MCDAVAAELVGNQSARLSPLTFQPLRGTEAKLTENVLSVVGAKTAVEAAIRSAEFWNTTSTAFHTTPLMSMEEGVAAMQKAGSLPYTRPGG